jgi:hypothetical protein
VSLLEKHFDIVEAFSAGSIPRFTALKAKSDVDVVLALHWGKHTKDKTPQQVLQSVRDALSEHKNLVRKNGQAVTLYYTKWPNVDIVPVTQMLDSNKTVVHYEVPNMNTGSWMPSNPKTHASDIEQNATVCGENFRKVIKIVKAWNASHSDYLQSYHIEVMALRTFSSAINDLPWDVLHAFTSFHDLTQSSIWHKYGWVDSYLSGGDRAEAVKRLATARDTARLAWYYGTQGNTKHAIEKWKSVFGGSFPSYG